MCAVAVTLGGLHLIAPTAEQDSDAVAATAASAIEGFANAAVAAFDDSAVGSDPALSPQQRRAGLPEDPVAGLTSPTAAGPVQVVLPGGLGPAQQAAGGQVIYPNAGAGFDFLAENTTTGTRTVARINGPAGPRMITTFVRTPADTVMLAHTNGNLTINRATPAAETIGLFSPAETRDVTGALVPSSYVVKQLAPQLYALAEVFDPQPGTTWPVYVDPPLHLARAGGAAPPEGLFDSVTNAVNSVTNTVTSAASTAMSATVSGAKAVGTFVKENPLESAMLVGGVALALTGVGGPASAAMIASATVNLASAGVDIAAAAMPDNQALGIASNVLGAASMVTPQGATKKVIKEGVEQAAEQLAKHTADIVDVAKAAPTPPAQLADEVAAARAAKPPTVPGLSPKAPNAPPTAGKTPEIPCAGQSFSPNTFVLLADGTSRPIAEVSIGDLVWSTDPATGRSGPQTVQAVLVNHDTDLLDLTITNTAGESALVHTTERHPFYSPSRAQNPVRGLSAVTTPSQANGPGWTDAADLRSGDGLYTPNGDAAEVKSVTPVDGDAHMWDLTIENTHTFYVTTTAAPVLVHNCPMPADYGPKSLPACTKLDCGHTTEVPSLVYNESVVPGHYNHNLDAIENGRPEVLTKGDPKDTVRRRRQATGHLPSAGEGKVKHEYPYASSEEGGRGAHVTSQLRSESDIEGDLVRSLSRDQKVRPGDRFTTTYRGTDGKTRCPECANKQRYDSQDASRQGVIQPSVRQQGSAGGTRQGQSTNPTKAKSNKKPDRKKVKQKRKQKHQDKKKQKKKNKKSKQNHNKPKG
ncbi:hypothetical protein CQY21_20805 [Mycolicibacterium boenickei]|uniref:polymorphic toxin-type HINT domain-containing protein n=1 Tax=Mycolicibacterium boenickei TaxID=146017 RepID=UPI00098AA8CE|nr:polymorphic toxin-type HINT domain-containing protein [Mycolicibacterium boenickei]PEG58792.1 hypothetical protein CQY21_20805 [Mycolicibacterium boenickei]